MSLGDKDKIEFRTSDVEPPAEDPPKTIYTDIVGLTDPAYLGLTARIYNYDDVGLYMRMDGSGIGWTFSTVDLGLLASGGNMYRNMDNFAYRSKPAAAVEEIVTVRLRAYTDAGYTNLKWTFTKVINVVFIKSDDGSWTQDMLSNFDDGTKQGWQVVKTKGGTLGTDIIASDFVLSVPYSYKAGVRDPGAEVQYYFGKAVTTPNRNNVFLIVNIRLSDSISGDPSKVGLKNESFQYDSTELIYLGRPYDANATDYLPNNKWIKYVVVLPKNTAMTLKIYVDGYSNANYDLMAWIDDIMIISKD